MDLTCNKQQQIPPVIDVGAFSGGFSTPDIYPPHEIQLYWCVENFSHLPKYLYSKELSTKDCKRKTLWRVQLHFCESSRKPKSLQLYGKLHRTDTREIPVDTQLRVSLTDNKEDILFDGSCTAAFAAECDTKSTSVSLWLQNESFFSLPDDELIIKVTVEISGCCTSNNLLQELLHVRGEHDVNIHLSQLQHDFRIAFENHLLPDFELIVSGEVLRANKFVLCSRSPFFKKMLTGSTENMQSYDVEPFLANTEAMEAFLSYVYTGFSKNVCLGTIYTLYSIAHKFEVATLQHVCGHILFSNINEYGVCDILNLADKYGDHTLKKAAMHYIETNLPKIKTTPSWIYLMQHYPRLYSEIHHFISSMRNNSSSVPESAFL